MECKRHFTLMEVVIGLLIAGALLGGLVRFYKNIAWSHADGEKIRERIFQREYVQQLLMPVFAGACSIDDELSCLYKKDFLGSEAFLFAFDHGVDRDPRFCGKLYAALYVDKREQLCLITSFEEEWLHDGASVVELVREKKARINVLATHIESIQFAFFDEKNSKWTQEIETVPLIVRLFVKEKDTKNSVEYAFFLSNTSQVIAYPKKEI